MAPGTATRGERGRGRPRGRGVARSRGRGCGRVGEDDSDYEASDDSQRPVESTGGRLASHEYRALQLDQCLGSGPPPTPQDFAEGVPSISPSRRSSQSPSKRGQQFIGDTRIPATVNMSFLETCNPGVRLKGAYQASLLLNRELPPEVKYLYESFKEPPGFVPHLLQVRDKEHWLEFI